MDTGKTALTWRHAGLVLLVVCLATACERNPAAVYAPISSLAFPDATLAACVHRAATDQGVMQAGRLRTLRCNGGTEGRIKTLDGLEQLPNIERLNLAHNFIRLTSPISRLDHLREIDLSDNHIEEPQFGPQNGIRSISLDHNRIVDLSWLQTPNELESLSVSHNRITEISPLGHAKALQHVDLSQNAIIDIGPLANALALETADLSANGISDVSALSSLGKLYSLNLSYNPIADVGPLVKLQNLQELSLDGTAVRDVSALRDIPSLERLSLRGDQLSSVLGLLDLGGLTLVDLQGDFELPCGEVDALVERFGPEAVVISGCAGAAIVKD
jgi:Leucine-rich repeat (LRR) protein